MQGLERIKRRTKMAKGIFNLKDLLYEDLVLFDIEASDDEKLLRKMSEKIKEKGFVKDTFADAIVKREQIFPTGLSTEGIKVAIPHTDIEHVITPCVTIARLKKPVIFKEMANEKNTVPAEIVFMLAMNAHDGQVNVLEKLMNIFCNKEVLLKLSTIDNAAEMIQVLTE